MQTVSVSVFDNPSVQAVVLTANLSIKFEFEDSCHEVCKKENVWVLRKTFQGGLCVVCLFLQFKYKIIKSTKEKVYVY